MLGLLGNVVCFPQIILSDRKPRQTWHSNHSTHTHTQASKQHHSLKSFLSAPKSLLILSKLWRLFPFPLLALSNHHSSENIDKEHVCNLPRCFSKSAQVTQKIFLALTLLETPLTAINIQLNPLNDFAESFIKPCNISSSQTHKSLIKQRQH